MSAPNRDARTWPPIPLSEEERAALMALCFLVRMGAGSIPRNPALLARLSARVHGPA